MSFLKHYFTEANNNLIVIYPGRFHPFHAGHYKSYQSLVNKFGKDNVYVATSNKIVPPNSPFSFDEKKKIITTMFDIPEDKVVQVKNPYIAIEITSKHPEKTPVVFAVGNKDADRLKVDTGKYFESYKDDKQMNGYKEHGYVYILSKDESVVNFEGKPISGTRIREIFQGDDENKKKELFETLYPKFDKYIYELLDKKIGE